MKICIVTGSNGLVGSESIRFFSSKKFKVIGIDNNFRKLFFGKNGDTSWVKKKLYKELQNYIITIMILETKTKFQEFLKNILGY